jgi:phospholipase C
MRHPRLVALLACLLLGASCTSTPDGSGTKGDRTNSAGPAASKTDVPRFPTRTPIQHVVFILKENRSFDNLFGLFPGAAGATEANDHGQVRPLVHSPLYGQRLPHDLPHDRAAALLAWDHGKMDGFSITSAADKYSYTQLVPKQLPNYWHWAENFVLSDHFFASALGPSFPNHLYAIAAQSGGAIDNPEPPPPEDFKWFKTWGCDSPDSEYVEVYDTEGNVERVPPCFDFQTVGDLLTKRTIPWRYYAATRVPRDDAPHSGYIWNAYAAIGRYRNNDRRWHQHIFPVERIVPDIQAERLPPVTYVTPRFALSEHPEYNFCHGENWTTEIIDAIMRSPMWESTAIFLTWDDWGGLYDHMPPPLLDRFGLGIRVPFLVISPYAKEGHIDRRPGEFSSVVRFIEDNWRLNRRLTLRDKGAGNLFYDFDFSQDPRPPDPLPLRSNCEGPAFSPPPPGAYG